MNDRDAGSPAWQGPPVQAPTPNPWGPPGQPSPEQWPPAPPRTPGATKGLLAAGALVVAVIGVTLAVVLAGDGAPAAQTVPRVVDIATKPTEVWTVDADPVDSDDVTSAYPVAVGDDLGLVWATFDPYSGDEFGDSAGWYEDATSGADEGTSRVPAPEGVDFAPSVTLFDVTDGQERWTVDLVAIEPGIDHTWYVNAVSLDGGATIAVSMQSGSYADYTRTTTIGTLDTSDGSVISTTTIEGTAWIYGIDGALLVVTESGEDDAAVIGRLDPTSLESGPAWENDVDAGAFVSTFADGQVGLHDGEDVVVLSVLDGTTLWEGERLLSVGTSVLSLEQDGDLDYTLQAETAKGDAPWDEQLEVATAWSRDGYLFTAAKGSDDSDATTTYREIQRVDPATGEELWETPVKEVTSISGVQRNTVVATIGDRVVMLDLRTGEETASHKIKTAEGEVEVSLGTDNVYVSEGGRLLAYSLGGDGKQWTYRVPDDAYVNQLGRHLVLWDVASGAVTGLEAQ